MQLSTLANYAQRDAERTATLPKHPGDRLIKAYNDKMVLVTASRHSYIIGDCVETRINTQHGKAVIMPFDVHDRLESAFANFHDDTSGTWQRLGWQPISYELVAIRETRTCWVLEFALKDESE